MTTYDEAMLDANPLDDMSERRQSEQNYFFDCICYGLTCIRVLLVSEQRRDGCEDRSMQQAFRV
jgi:hypothetical protein